MTTVRFGRIVKLQTERSSTRRNFRIGLEAVEKGTGRLLPESGATYDGDGIAFREGDVLFGKLRPNLRKVWLADRAGDAVGDFHVYRPVDSIMTSRYLAYVLLSEPFLGPVAASVYGAKMPRADWRELRNIEVWTPQLHEQRAIAAYLDRETAQIDAFIAKSEELIVLLAERRSAVARATVETHVGGGTRVKHHYREVDTRAGGTWAESRLLSVSIHDGVTSRKQNSSATADDMSHYKKAQAGDIVLNRMRAFQGGLGVAPCSGLVSPDYAILRPAADVDPNWLTLVMRTPVFVGEMVRRLRGIGSTDSGAVRTPRISVKELGDILVTVPALEVQQREVTSVSTSTSRIVAAITSAQRGVELARERRAALISAAVRGKIDVGGNA